MLYYKVRSHRGGINLGKSDYAIWERSPTPNPEEIQHLSIHNNSDNRNLCIYVHLYNSLFFRASITLHCRKPQTVYRVSGQIYIYLYIMDFAEFWGHCRGCDSGCDILDILDRCRRVSVIEIILSNFQVEWQEYLQAAHRSNGVPLIRMQLWEGLHDPRL